MSSTASPLGHLVRTAPQLCMPLDRTGHLGPAGRSRELARPLPASASPEFRRARRAEECGRAGLPTVGAGRDTDRVLSASAALNAAAARRSSFTAARRRVPAPRDSGTASGRRPELRQPSAAPCSLPELMSAGRDDNWIFTVLQLPGFTETASRSAGARRRLEASAGRRPARPWGASCPRPPRTPGGRAAVSRAARRREAGGGGRQRDTPSASRPFILAYL